MHECELIFLAPVGDASPTSTVLGVQLTVYQKPKRSEVTASLIDDPSLAAPTLQLLLVAGHFRYIPTRRSSAGRSNRTWAARRFPCLGNIPFPSGLAVRTADSASEADQMVHSRVTAQQDTNNRLADQSDRSLLGV